MTKKAGFRLPERPAQDLQEWVEGGSVPAETDMRPSIQAKAALPKPARLTIDLPAELHARFKAACAIKQTRMVDEVNRFIDEWTQKHR